VASLRAGMLGKWRTNMVSAIPGQRSSVHVWGNEIKEKENLDLDNRERLLFERIGF
jgi:hypothetical protein